MAEIKDSNLLNIFSKMLNRPVLMLERIGGGHNSKVCKITCDDKQNYVGKQYFVNQHDNRDRMGTEYLSFQLLWQNGFRSIPKPVTMQRDTHCAVYEYVEGEPLRPQDVSMKTIDGLVSFLIDIQEIKNSTGVERIPNASEACFSLQSLLDNLQVRVKRLKELAFKTHQSSLLQRFMFEKFTPVLNEIYARSSAKHAELGISEDFELPLEDRILSPSDFGFHNARRRTDGKLVFLDFEYFGWDDPAKTISDFLLHPAMMLATDRKTRFIRKTRDGLRLQKDFLLRLKAVFPLFGLKWCLIMLNEFLPADMERRCFAEAQHVRREVIRSKQLAKADALLERIRSGDEENTYFE